MDIVPGDILLSINGRPVKDVFDYRYLIQDETVELLIKKIDGEEWLLEIEKDEDEDIGIVFESGLMDKAKHCANKCIFCFIDQLPPGMRETLYFKDDDARLSFLSGNYVTMTNMSRDDLDRIVYYHLSPINISIHTTDPELRRFMLKHPNAGGIQEAMERLAEAGIDMNYQIVLCKGVNDGVHLDKSIADLSRLIPRGRSLSVVPVGLTKHRERLFPLEPFTKQDSIALIKQINGWQQKLMKEKGQRFVFAADEFYLLAGESFPEYEEYDGFPQLENGVGMSTLFQREFELRLLKINKAKKRRVSVVTGIAAGPQMQALADGFMQKFPATEIDVFAVDNRFFGERITVSGLLTARDIIGRLGNETLGDELLIPANALRDGTDIFLDDQSTGDLERTLGIKVRAVEIDGGAFADALSR